MTQKIKILYVDDEAINLQLFKINLSRQYEIFIASSGREGLGILSENPDIDVIFSDLRMPEMNGFEFIQEARKLFPEKKYFILTGFDINQEIMAAIQSGQIINFFRKPFKTRDIELAISSAIA
ncbi:MAG: response regulator [Bacteroidales bacterium]|nr:response regulator [Bacteroidales bacterium]